MDLYKDNEQLRDVIQFDLPKYSSQTALPSEPLSLEQKKELSRFINVNIVSMAKDYPLTMFIFIIPPNFVAAKTIKYKNGILEQEGVFLKEVLLQAEKLENFEVYGVTNFL